MNELPENILGIIPNTNNYLSCILWHIEATEAGPEIEYHRSPIVAWMIVEDPDEEGVASFPVLANGMPMDLGFAHVIWNAETEEWVMWGESGQGKDSMENFLISEWELTQTRKGSKLKAVKPKKAPVTQLTPKK